MKKNTVIVSPHFDDGMFSCFYLIQRSRSTLLTVFTKIPSVLTNTLWDRLCGQTSSAKMVLNRQEENSKANQPFKTKLINLDFLDHQYRKDKLNPQQITKSLKKQISYQDHLYFPMSLSLWYRHPDHQSLTQVGLDLIKQNYLVSFYVDQPYMSTPTIFKQYYKKRLQRRINKNFGLNYQIEIIKLPKDLKNLKKRSIKTYQSQYFWTNLVSFGNLSYQTFLGQEVYANPQ
jgi:LmbE family N-acetylglucosaminyl deacetylase